MPAQSSEDVRQVQPTSHGHRRRVCLSFFLLSLFLSFFVPGIKITLIRPLCDWVKSRVSLSFKGGDCGCGYNTVHLPSSRQLVTTSSCICSFDEQGAWSSSPSPFTEDHGSEEPTLCLRTSMKTGRGRTRTQISWLCIPWDFHGADVSWCAFIYSLTHSLAKCIYSVTHSFIKVVYSFRQYIH